MSEEAPAYFIAAARVKNHRDYLEQYGMPLVALLQKIGAEVVAWTPTAHALEGEWPGTWTVVIRFPSMSVAKAFYESPEYQPLKELRVNQLTKGGTAILVDGFDPALLSL